MTHPHEKAMKPSQFALPTLRNAMFEGSYAKHKPRQKSRMVELRTYLQQDVWNEENQDGDRIAVAND